MLDPEQVEPEHLRPLYRHEYERMVELGLFEHERVELLRGALVAMSPQGPLHAEVTEALAVLRRRSAAGGTRIVRPGWMRRLRPSAGRSPMT